MRRSLHYYLYELIWIRLGIVGQVFVDDNSFYTICEPAWYKLACGYMWIFVIFFFLTILLLLKNNNAIYVCVWVSVCNGIVIKFFYQDHSFFFPSFPVLVNWSIEYGKWLVYIIIKVLMAGLAIYAFWYNLWAKSSTDNWQPFNQTYFIYDTALFLFFGYVHI